MKKNFLFTSWVVSSVLAFGLIGTTPVAAQSTQTTNVSVVQTETGGGTGTLNATGNGVARVRGNGTFTVSGSGVLRYRDWGGDAQVTVDGKGRNSFTGKWTRLAGFRGSATITGKDVTIELAGANINLQANGTGKYVLRGDGSYSTTISGTTGTGNWVSAKENVLTLP